MLRSMTGFGRCVIESEFGMQTWELRSVNGRHLDIKWRLPSQLRYLESRFERLLKKGASRGRVEVSMVWQPSELLQERVYFDEVRARAMCQTLVDFSKNNFSSLGLGCESALSSSFDVMSLLRIDRLWHQPSQDEPSDSFVLELEKGLAMAIEDWNESRETEASALKRDLIERCMRLEEWVSHIGEQAPRIKEERFSVLRERVQNTLSEHGHDLDESRFLHELVLYSDKLDISEELTRLDAHLERFRELLAEGSDAGRRLDFTLQECFREITTCGNKVQDALLSRVVVDCKNELEKCREQVQNLE